VTPPPRDHIVVFFPQRLASTTCAPAVANAIAVCSPMPVLEPVTTATCPDKSTVGILLARRLGFIERRAAQEGARVETTVQGLNFRPCQKLNSQAPDATTALLALQGEGERRRLSRSQQQAAATELPRSDGGTASAFLPVGVRSVLPRRFLPRHARAPAPRSHGASSHSPQPGIWTPPAQHMPNHTLRSERGNHKPTRGIRSRHSWVLRTAWVIEPPIP
jgi:hypothetical protein